MPFAAPTPLHAPVRPSRRDTEQALPITALIVADEDQLSERRNVRKRRHSFVRFAVPDVTEC
jgi:hypothetical protein